MPALAAACPGTSPCLTVHLPDGRQQTVSGADVTRLADVHETQYRTRAVSGGPTQDEPYVQAGLSVRHLLDSLTPPFDPGSVGFTETPRLDGSWSTLTARDVGSPSDFTGGLLPVLRVDGRTLDYIRPLRPGTSDTNADDQVQAEQLDLFVHSGALLTVSSSASTTQPSPGSPVLFRASAQGAAPPIDYSWDFGDGAGATGQVASHAYPLPGSYRVLVTAAGPNDSGGAAPPLVITVPGAAGPSPTASAPASPAPSPAARRPRRARARTGAVASRAPGGPGSGATSAAGTPARPSGGPAALLSPAPAARVSPAPVLRASVAPVLRASLAPAARVSPPPALRPRAARAAVRKASAVRGLLLTAESTAVHGAGSSQRAADRTQAATGAPPLPGLGAGVLAVALLGLGAVRELRRLPRPAGAGR